jgi:hypothetical protein
MSDGDSIAQAAVVILLLMLAVPALSTAHASAGTPIEHEEVVTIDADGSYQVAENATSERYRDNVTISVNNQQLIRGQDFTWDDQTGTVSWINSSDVNTGATAEIQFTANQRTAETQAAWSIIAPFMGLFGLFSFYATVRALLRIVDQAFEGVDL